MELYISMLSNALFDFSVHVCPRSSLKVSQEMCGVGGASAEAVDREGAGDRSCVMSGHHRTLQ